MTDTVATHWDQKDLFQQIERALIGQGFDLANLTIKDLSPIDHVHARGLQSTIELMDLLPIKAGDTILDIGCGIGGPARYVADRFHCRTTGIDITEVFIEVASKLSQLTGMTAQTEFILGDGQHLPYDDASFDGAYSQHVTMNVADRKQFFSEAFRVIKPGGFFAVTEHGLGPKGDLYYPVPWSKSGEHEYLKPPEETQKILTNTGFTNINQTATGEQYLKGYQKAIERAESGQAPALGPHIVIGPDALLVTKNAAKNIAEARTFPVQFICRKPG